MTYPNRHESPLYIEELRWVLLRSVFIYNKPTPHTRHGKYARLKEKQALKHRLWGFQAFQGMEDALFAPPAK